MASEKKKADQRKQSKKFLKRQYVPTVPKKSNTILTNPDEVKEDILLVESAVRKGWNVENKGLIRKRIEEIVMKKTGEVVTKEGVIDSETKADELAIAGARVLALMDKDDVNRVESFKPKLASNTNINIINNNVQALDDKQLALIELSERLGVRELVIDGDKIIDQRESKNPTS
mgnify:CR=1 FL=1